MNHDEFDQFRSELEKQALRFEPSMAFWPSEDPEEDCYCEACFDERFGNDAEYEISGYGTEYDYTLHCVACGNALCCVLTEEGAFDELNAFSETGLDMRQPEECWEFERVINTWLGMGHWTLNNFPKDVRRKVFDIVTNRRQQAAASRSEDGER